MALYINGQLYSGDGITRSTSDYSIYVPSGKSIDMYIGGAKVFDLSNDGTKSTILGLSGDYWRIGDNAVTGHNLNSEDDLMVTGEFEVKVDSFFDGQIYLKDGGSLTSGTGFDSKIRYETADADAKCMVFVIDESDDSGNNVPAWVFGEETNAIAVDFGLLDEIVQPHLITMENSGKYTEGTDATSSGASATMTKTGAFASSVVGDIVRVTSGTNATAGWYWITTATDDDNIILDRNWGSGSVTSGAFVAVHKLGMVTPKALYLPIYDGAPQDSDIDIDMAGAMALDVGQSNGAFPAPVWKREINPVPYLLHCRVAPHSSSPSYIGSHV